ncbi:MAG: right-handed parallel beta-helix repeat-containing protein [Bacteroidales bacterium]|nr:right-handed parallel beta-helix repeat-containing protein [Bacteroidales bacterium]
MLKLGLKYVTVVFLLIASNSFAVNYYLATDGKSTNSGTSISSPFNDLFQAIILANPGDTIFIRSGTYIYQNRITITKTGVSDKRIVIMAYPDDIVSVYPADGRPLFDFSAMAAGSSNQGFLISGSQYLHIKGIRITGAGDNGMIVRNSNNNIFEYCEFFKNRDSGFQIVDGSADNLILNCDSYMNADIGDGLTSDGGNADGFAPKLTVGTGNIFRGCRSWLNSDDGWDGYLKTTGTAYPDGMTTTLENCWTWSNGYYWLDGSTNSGMNGNGFKMGGSDNKDLAHNFILKRCLSFYNKSKGFDQNSNAGSITLYNCTSHDNGNKEYMLNSTTNVVYVTGSVFTVKNCISLSDQGSTFKSGTVLETNDLSTLAEYFISTDTSGVAGRRAVDGKLPIIDFMHLQTQPASPLIDAGTIIEGIEYNDAKPDLGCFETGIPLSTGFLNIENEAFLLFPNPAMDYFNFSVSGDENEVFIFSTEGKLVKTATINSLNEKIDISDLKKGLYFVKTKLRTLKLIKI